MNGRVAAGVGDGEEVVRDGLDDRLVADAVEGFGAECSGSAQLGRVFAVAGHLVHDDLPSSRRNLGIMRGEVGARHGEIDGGLMVG